MKVKQLKNKPDFLWKLNNHIISRMLIVTGIIIFIILPYILSPYSINVITKLLIFAIFAMSLNLLVGNLGLVSLGHAAFFGVGAYTAGILVTSGVGNFWITLGGGIFASIVVAIMFGILVARTSGAYFLMLTFALGQMLYSIAWKWRSFTGGDDGLPGITRPDLGIPLSLWDTGYFYYFTFAFFLLALVLLHRITNSVFGKILLGIRESESRMRVLGYNTWVYKYVAYILAGAFAGLAGIFYVYHNGYVHPGILSFDVSGQVLLMVIIGGIGTFYGPLIGAGTVLFLQYIVSIHTERWPLVMGVIFIFCVMYVPKGIFGYLSQKWMKNRGDYNDSLKD